MDGEEFHRGESENTKFSQSLLLLCVFVRNFPDVDFASQNEILERG